MLACSAAVGSWRTNYTHFMITCPALVHLTTKMFNHCAAADSQPIIITPLIKYILCHYDFNIKSILQIYLCEKGFNCTYIATIPSAKYVFISHLNTPMISGFVPLCHHLMRYVIVSYSYLSFLYLFLPNQSSSSLMCHHLIQSLLLSDSCTFPCSQ